MVIVEAEEAGQADEVRPESARTWTMSRRLIRLVWVAGVLALVGAWRLDQAVATAYGTHWVAPHSDFLTRAQTSPACRGCWRLPGHGWVLAYTTMGSLGLGLLAMAVAIYGRRRYTTIGLGIALAMIGLGLAALTAAGLAALFRYRSGSGDGDQTGWAIVFQFLGLAAITLAALGVAVAKPDDGVTKSFLSRAIAFLRTQFAPLVVGILFAALLLLVGQTSGQAIDSMRTWTPTTARGLARIGFGTAAALLLALVIYEVGLRTIQQARNQPYRQAMNPLFWLFLSAVFVVGWWRLPFGDGVGVLAAIAFTLFLLDAPRFAEPAPNPPAWTLINADDHSAEYAAIIPLLAIAAAAVSASVDGGLAGHARLAGLGPLLPAVVMALAAVLLTGEGERPRITGASWQWAWAVPVIVVSGIALTSFGAYVSRHWALVGAALAGGVAAVFTVVYAARLFWRSWDENETHGAAAVSLAAAAGIALTCAVALDPFGVSPSLGTFALVALWLAFIFAVGSMLAQIARRYRAPTLLWWLGARRFPLVPVLAIAWFGAGLVAPPDLHNVALVPRLSVNDNPERLRLETAFNAWLAAQPPTPPRLEDAFKEWVAAQPELNGSDADPPGAPIPMLLVAAHGGGIKAAYWTDLALDCIVGIRSTGMNLAALQSGSDAERQATCQNDRRAPAEQRAAARRIFIASGVSGGAVGLDVYSRQLLGAGSLPDNWVHERLSHDFASPTIGWAVFHDVPNHILGLHVDPTGSCRHKLRNECWGADRGTVIADTFDRWFKRDAEGPFAPDLRLTWDMRSSSTPGLRTDAQLVPLLIDNSTATGGKARVVTSAADLGMWPRLETENPAEGGDYPLAGTAEVIDAICANEDMSLSTAAILASRFPYVSPSGRIAGHCRDDPSQANAYCEKASPKTCQMRLVDGGYAENSGLLTIDALWPKLRELVASYNRKNLRRPIAPVIVELDNHYRASEPSEIAGSGTGLETVVPPVTGFGAHAAMETFARALAYRLRPRGCTATISPGLHPGLTAPLGWELSDAAQKDLRHALVEPHPVESGIENSKTQPWAAALELRTLQQWISAGLEPPIVGRPRLSSCAPL